MKQLIVRSLRSLVVICMCGGVAQTAAQSTRTMSPSIRAEVEKADLVRLKREADENGVYWSDTGIPLEMVKAVNQSRKNGNYGFSLFAPNGGWLVSNRLSGAAGNGLPSEALQQVNDIINSGKSPVRHALFGSRETWFYHYGMNEGTYRASNKLPQKLLEKMDSLYKSIGPSAFDDAILTTGLASNDGWVVVYRRPSAPTWGTYRPNKWEAAWDNVPDDFVAKLRELQTQQAGLRVVFAPNGGWLILYNNTEFAHSSIPQAARDKLAEFKTNRKQIMDAAFSPKGGWVLVTRGKHGL